MTDPIRAAFESWVTNPPYSRSIKRAENTLDSYSAREVQFMWEAWLASYLRTIIHREQ